MTTSEAKLSHRWRKAFLELRDRVVFVHLHHIEIRIPDPTVWDEILAEIGACHRLVQLALDERLIGFVNDTTGVGVGDKETKRNISMRLTIAVDVLHMESYNLGRCNARKLCRHAVATKGNGSYRGRAANDCNLARCDRGVEGKDRVVGRGATTFHP